MRQHAWAEAVERVTALSDHDVKEGKAPEEFLEYFKLASDGLESKLDHWRDMDLDLKMRRLTIDQARNLYAEYEQRYRQSDGYEVVMIGADSIDTIRKTHAHYFGDFATNPFAELLGDE